MQDMDVVYDGYLRPLIESFGLVVSINEVTLRWARLVLGLAVGDSVPVQFPVQEA